MKPTDKNNGLSVERLRSLLSYNAQTGLFVWLQESHKSMSSVKVGDVAGSKDNTGYVRLWIDGKRYVAHRLAWLYVTGKWPSEQIDHINGDRLDNRISNLREATPAHNSYNKKRKKRGASGLQGVELHISGKYRARITKNKKIYHLGLFASAEEAKTAYNAASLSLFGEFSGSDRE